MRAQSSVVGVALLMGITVVALGLLTASVGTVVEQHAARADTAAVGDALADLVVPTRTSGTRSTTLTFTDGRLHTVERDLRVLNSTGGVVARRPVNALVYRHGDHRVAASAGAVVQGSPGNARFVREPSLGAAGSVVLVDAGVIRGDLDVGGTGQVRTRLRLRVTHDRTDLGNRTVRVAIETTTPGPWRAYFERQGATVVSRDVDGDGVESVVARYPGERHAYLLTHTMRLAGGGA